MNTPHVELQTKDQFSRQEGSALFVPDLVLHFNMTGQASLQHMSRTDVMEMVRNATLNNKVMSKGPPGALFCDVQVGYDYRIPNMKYEIII